MNFHSIYAPGAMGRYQLEEILLYLESHPGSFTEIFEIAFEDESKAAFRAMWTLEKISQRNPDWFSAANQQKMILHCENTNHTGIRRLLLSIMRELPVPDPLPVNLLNKLYDWMLLPKYPAGIQSLAMKLLHKWSATNSDLLREFICILEQADINEYTAAFLASRRNILKCYK